MSSSPSFALLSVPYAILTLSVRYPYGTHTLSLYIYTLAMLSLFLSRCPICESRQLSQQLQITNHICNLLLRRSRSLLSNWTKSMPDACPSFILHVAVLGWGAECEAAWKNESRSVHICFVCAPNQLHIFLNNRGNTHSSYKASAYIFHIEELNCARHI